MSTSEFKHFVLRHVDGVVVLEMVSKDIQGPDRAKEFIAELMSVVDQDNPAPIVLCLHRTCYFSSMGYSALFKLVKCARERQRAVRFCNMHPDVRRGGDIVGLPMVVEIDDCMESSLKAFATA